MGDRHSKPCLLCCIGCLPPPFHESTLFHRVAEASSEILRQANGLARFAGQEFTLFLPPIDPLDPLDPPGALDVAERIRAPVLALDHGWTGHKLPVNVSLGGNPLSLAHFIQAAQAALRRKFRPRCALAVRPVRQGVEYDPQHGFSLQR